MFRVFGVQLFKIHRLSDQLSVILMKSTQTQTNFVRNISTNLICNKQFKSKAEEIAERKRKDQERKWTKLYHFTNMKYHSIITRLKVYPFLTGLIGTPIAYGIEMSHTIPEFTFLPFLAISATTTAMLTLYSTALTNTIGIVYTCSANKHIQIAYIDFWGRQCFMETTVEELHNAEKSNIKFGLYKNVTVKIDNEQVLLKLPWNAGDISNIKTFRRCFGK